MIPNLRRLLSFFLVIFSCSISYGQRAEINKEEFAARRQKLMEKLDADMILLFGKPGPETGAPFRQDNDFYYFTGIEEAGSALILLPSSRRSILLQPVLSPREIYVSGSNLLSAGTEPSEAGFDAIIPISDLDEYIVRNCSSSGSAVYTRISPPDVVNGGRSETDLYNARAARSHYNDQSTLNTHRVNKLKHRYPYIHFHDVAPLIDGLRVIKTEWEKEILRKNGRVSAEGVKAAIMATRPGVYEYEIEAAAMNVVMSHGALGAAYPPIVASGPNTCTLHYEKSSRQAEDGDLLLIDFGACMDYLTMDISRTWPVSGKFSPEQRKVYTLLLEIQKACIESYRPGVKQGDVIEYVYKKLSSMKFDLTGLENYISHSMKPPVENGKLKVENIIGGFGHFVGMAVHDVGVYGDEGLKPGMVFAIEPGLYNPGTGIGIRIEDTVLITEDGCEVLSRAVPKEIDEIEALMRK
ncbi:MAG: aminopeptidase P N-terminal domain-containing protein [Bacteroidales bacterium]|nr:aminopeptidase P N-terminal domain-containing protein [Bacteroidales bacterium]